MKIAFILSAFPTLSETFILNQITGLLDLGHEVDIFANSNPNQEKVHPDVKAYRLMERTHYFNMPANKVKRVLKALGLLAANFYKAPLTLLKALNVFKYGKDALSLRLLYALVPFLGREQEYDIIHCHFGPNGNLGAMLKMLGLKGKLVVTFHGYDMSAIPVRQSQNIYRRLFGMADLLMPISDHWKAKLIEMGANPGKVIVHRMGINLQRFRFKARSCQGNEAVKLLTVGRLVKKKGIEYALRAVSVVCQRHPERSIQYDIVGEGPLRKELESLTYQLGVQKAVRLLGAKTHDEAQRLMMQAHIFLLPSVTARNGDQEGIPVSLMEAMATGMPVLSTVHSGIPELVQNRKSGFLVPERDVDALAERLEYLIEHPELWPEMGRAGRRFVEEHFDIKKLNRRLVEIYEALLQGEEVG